MRNRWNLLCAALLLGSGVAAADILNFSFEQPGTPPLTGKGRFDRGKPSNGQALFLEEEAYAEIPAPAALQEAERRGTLAAECWILRDEDDCHGFIMRQDGAFSLLVIPWDPRRINLGVWNQDEYVSLDTEPCLRSGFWQHIAATIDGAEVRLYVDGKLQLSHRMKSPMRVSGQSLYLGGAINAGKFIGGLAAGIDEVRISGRIPNADYFNRILAACTENFDATQQRIGLPPVIAPARSITESVPVQIRRNPASIEVENSHYRFTLSTGSGLRLQQLFNKYGGVECLTAAGSPLFSAAVDGRSLKPESFRVESVRAIPEKDGRKLIFELANDAEKLRSQLTVTVSASRDIGLDYTFTNTGPERRVQLTAPMLDNLSIGPDFEENYYFWPMITGWVGKKSYELGMAYGNRCWIQMSDVFSPKHGAGIALSGRDTGGEVKGIVVRKTRKDGRIGVNYNINFLPMTPMASPFPPESRGLAMANTFLPAVLKTGEIRQLPPALLTVHPGDVLEPLKDYRRWAASWLRRTPVPESIRSDFNLVAVHRKVGNRGFEKGFGGTKGKLRLADFIHPDGRDHQLQLAMWWKEHHPGQIASGEGDYEYCDELGGRAGMELALRQALERGTKVCLYLCSRQAGNDSEVAKHEELAFHPTPGVRANDWGSFNPCTHAHAWQDLLASKYRKLARELPLSGLYLDTSAEFLLCANPGHPHAPNLIDDQIRLLSTVRQAIKENNPEAYFFTEFMGSEFFGQYIDACWIQTFANPHAAAFNNYDLDFVRFALPQVKYFEWGMNEHTFEVDSRRIFFNGVGGGRGDLTDAQNDRFADLTNTLREAAAALATPEPEPFVPTAAERLYANRFSTDTLTAWTLYNKTGAAFDGQAFPALPGRRHVELLYDQMPDVENGMVKLSLAKDDVTLVAAFLPVLTATKQDNHLEIRLNERYRPDMTLTCHDAERDSRAAERPLTVRDGRAVIACADFPGKRLIVKLRQGTDLIDQLVITL